MTITKDTSDECTCWGEQLRREAEETGFLKLVGTTPGYAEDGSICPLHDPRKKMTEQPSSTEAMRQAQKERGEQLRALIISWHEDTTFVEALAEQTKAIEEGSFDLNHDWEIMANEVYAAFTSQPRMTAWDDEPKQEDDGPKIVIP